MNDTDKLYQELDVCIDTAFFLNNASVGVYSPFGLNGNIVIEEAPTKLIGNTVISLVGGLKRELKIIHDTRYPIIQIMVAEKTRREVKKKLRVISDTLEQVTFDTPYSSYYYRLQSDIATWKVSDSEYRGSVNILAKQEIRIY